MRIVFMGTPDFAVQSLDALVQAGHIVAAVITQPDRPKGRGNKLGDANDSIFKVEVFPA